MVKYLGQYASCIFHNDCFCLWIQFGVTLICYKLQTSHGLSPNNILHHAEVQKEVTQSFKINQTWLIWRLRTRTSLTTVFVLQIEIVLYLLQKTDLLSFSLCGSLLLCSLAKTKNFWNAKSSLTHRFHLFLLK